MKSTSAYLLATAALGLGLAGCSSPSTPASETAAGGATVPPVLTPGPWRGALAAQGQEIPFLFEVKTEADKPVVYLINQGLNGEERLRCDDIKSAGDSTTIRLHAFDAALVVRADGAGKLKGSWVTPEVGLGYAGAKAAVAVCTVRVAVGTKPTRLGPVQSSMYTRRRAKVLAEINSTISFRPVSGVALGVPK